MFPEEIKIEINEHKGVSVHEPAHMAEVNAVTLAAKVQDELDRLEKFFDVIRPDHEEIAVVGKLIVNSAKDRLLQALGLMHDLCGDIFLLEKPDAPAESNVAEIVFVSNEDKEFPALVEQQRWVFQTSN